MSARLLINAALVAFVATPGAGQVETPAASGSPDVAAETTPANRIVSAIRQEELRLLLRDVLERNPEIAAAEARARAALQRAPQARALPDPIAGFRAYVLPPETRVGPQELSGVLSQKFPWFGKLRLREQRELYGAEAARADVEALRLRLVTETRRLYYELGFLDAYDLVVRADRSTLSHYEELARARYGSGVGLQQAVVKIQAEITIADSRILEIADRRATAISVINSLRDFPLATFSQPTPIPDLPAYSADLSALRTRALELRPELASADADIARSETLIDLAVKDYKPDLRLGLSYTYVGNRTDPAGRLNPPPDNGEDVLALSAAINLPIKRKKLAAGVEEAVQIESASQRTKQFVITRIDRALGEFPQRIDLTWQQLRLFEDVLSIQAEQSLLSAEAGYSAGSQDALDLLDAERVLLDVRTGTERNRADYAIAIAQLEGAVGEPLIHSHVSGEEN